MAFRLVQGELLMSAVVDDAGLAVAALAALESVDATRIGAIGHSMGGHTVLFSAALDERVAFACVSGAASGYRARIASRAHIEPAQAERLGDGVRLFGSQARATLDRLEASTSGRVVNLRERRGRRAERWCRRHRLCRQL